ncbi:hypothetical protein P7C73_g6168, partial [Tremellales sp. Uapishka_1]
MTMTSPFDRGEMCVPMDISPMTIRRGDGSGSERRADGGRETVEDPAASDGNPTVIDVSSGEEGSRPPSEPEWEGCDDWGEDAVLAWEPAEESTNREASVSSVAASEAGIEEDEEEEWGREACLDWQCDAEDDSRQPSLSTASLHSASSEGENEGSAMPDYESMDIKALQVGLVSCEWQSALSDFALWQKLIKSYGYKPSRSHAALVKVAEDCWSALNASTPKAKPKPKPKPKLKSMPKKDGENDSSSSEDIPLSAKKATKAKTKGKEKEVVKIDLMKEFYDMVVLDEALYIRILRYEPISFDELVSRALARGIEERGWKLRLKSFLDQKSITYFTEDPTGQRKRH